MYWNTSTGLHLRFNRHKLNAADRPHLNLLVKCQQKTFKLNYLGISEQDLPVWLRASGCFSSVQFSSVLRNFGLKGCFLECKLFLVMSCIFWQYRGTEWSHPATFYSFCSLLSVEHPDLFMSRSEIRHLTYWKKAIQPIGRHLMCNKFFCEQLPVGAVASLSFYSFESQINISLDCSRAFELI